MLIKYTRSGSDPDLHNLLPHIRTKENHLPKKAESISDLDKGFIQNQIRQNIFGSRSLTRLYKIYLYLLIHNNSINLVN